MKVSAETATLSAELARLEIDHKFRDGEENTPFLPRPGPLQCAFPISKQHGQLSFFHLCKHN